MYNLSQYIHIIRDIGAEGDDFWFKFYPPPSFLASMSKSINSVISNDDLLNKICSTLDIQSLTQLERSNKQLRRLGENDSFRALWKAQLDEMKKIFLLTSPNETPGMKRAKEQPRTEESPKAADPAKFGQLEDDSIIALKKSCKILYTLTNTNDWHKKYESFHLKIYF